MAADTRRRVVPLLATMPRTNTLLPRDRRGQVTMSNTVRPQDHHQVMPITGISTHRRRVRHLAVRTSMPLRLDHRQAMLAMTMLLLQALRPGSTMTLLRLLVLHPAMRRMRLRQDRHRLAGMTNMHHRQDHLRGTAAAVTTMHLLPGHLPVITLKINMRRLQARLPRPTTGLPHRPVPLHRVPARSMTGKPRYLIPRCSRLHRPSSADSTRLRRQMPPRRRRTMARRGASSTPWCRRWLSTTRRTVRSRRVTSG